MTIAEGAMLAQLAAKIAERLIALAGRSAGLPARIDVGALVSRREQLRLQRLARLERARRAAG